MGRQFKRMRPGAKQPWLTIVGIVPDLLMEAIGTNNASPVGYYIPIAQSDVANGVRIAVRTTAQFEGAPDGIFLRRTLAYVIRSPRTGSSGLVAAVALARVMASLLFEVSPIDPLTYALVCASLASAAMLASYLPALRATGINPVSALRAE
jgi:hypothetical protein